MAADDPQRERHSSAVAEVGRPRCGARHTARLPGRGGPATAALLQPPPSPSSVASHEVTSLGAGRVAAHRHRCPLPWICDSANKRRHVASVSAWRSETPCFLKVSVPSDQRSPPRGRSRRAPGGLDAVSQDVTGTPASSLCLPVCSLKLTRWENKCISFLEELKRVGPSRSPCFRPSHGEQVEGHCAGPLAAWAPAGVCPRAGHQKPGRIGTGPGCTDEADQSASAEVSVAKAALWAPRDRRLQLAAPPAADSKRDANPTRERLARLPSQRRTSDLEGGGAVLPGAERAGLREACDAREGRAPESPPQGQFPQDPTKGRCSRASFRG